MDHIYKGITRCGLKTRLNTGVDVKFLQKLSENALV